MFGRPRSAVSRREADAFEELANTLIFETPRRLRIDAMPVEVFAQMLQDEFYHQDATHQRELQLYVEQSVETAMAALQIESKPGSVEKPDIVKKERKGSFRSRLVSASRMLMAATQIDDSYGYGSWGFTPKLAGMRTDEKLRFMRYGRNCLGSAIALGGLYRHWGASFKMGITADHPFVIVDMDSDRYLAGLGGIQKAKGSFKRFGTREIYRFSPKDDLAFSMMVVCDFDHGVMYELLENFELLRRLVHGDQVRVLPGTQEFGAKLAQQHRGTLTACDWRALQGKLVPSLARYFEQARREWAAELDTIGCEREIQHFCKVLMEAARTATSMKDAPLANFIKAFNPIAKRHGRAIVAYVRDSVAFTDDVPADVRGFTETAKTILGEIEREEIREHVTKIFLRPFAGSVVDSTQRQRIVSTEGR